MIEPQNPYYLSIINKDPDFFSQLHNLLMSDMYSWKKSFPIGSQILGKDVLISIQNISVIIAYSNDITLKITKIKPLPMIRSVQKAYNLTFYTNNEKINKHTQEIKFKSFDSGNYFVTIDYEFNCFYINYSEKNEIELSDTYNIDDEIYSPIEQYLNDNFIESEKFLSNQKHNLSLDYELYALKYDECAIVKQFFEHKLWKNNVS